MIFKLTTYKTLTGKKEILEFAKKKSASWIIYKNNNPTYFVDCFDLQTESNVLMNGLVLCEKRSIKDVLKEINQKENVDLSIKEAPLFGFEDSSVLKELELEPLPEEWIDY